MSDDLICTNCGEYAGSHVADRIEELEAKLAKLAKAVEVLAELATDVYPHDWRAIAALAELKGQDDE